MPSLTDQTLLQGNIIVVDDDPANLKLLERMLRQHGYEVRPFQQGRLALAAAEQEPPEVILLDIDMPEMNGYQVCEHLKASNGLSGIPVIFLSALSETEDKVKAFRSGGVDYIPKPFQFDEVHARVETQIRLRRAQQAEHDLLEKTLSGAVGTVWDLVQVTSPALALRSHAIRDIVARIADGIGISEAWQCELAATLCLLGCISLPDEVFERGYSGQPLSPDEDLMFRAHPQTAARLLSNIPRLEVVVEIILGQQKPAEASAGEQAVQGSRILHLALELDRRIYRGIPSLVALAELRSMRRYDVAMLDTLETYSPEPAEFDTRRVSIRELHSGMILDKDVLSKDGGLLILKEGTILNETWIERLENFAKARGAQQPISVRIPRLRGIGQLEEFWRSARRGSKHASAPEP